MHQTLIRMLKQLLEEMMVLHQQGAGYYSCVPVIRRYNKLLGQARRLFTEDTSLIGTFDVLEERDPKDPADKMIVIQGIRVEIGQLISLLESDMRLRAERGAQS
jgi:hypothetical protein